MSKVTHSVSRSLDADSSSPALPLAKHSSLVSDTSARSAGDRQASCAAEVHFGHLLTRLTLPRRQDGGHSAQWHAPAQRAQQYRRCLISCLVPVATTTARDEP